MKIASASALNNAGVPINPIIELGSPMVADNNKGSSRLSLGKVTEGTLLGFDGNKVANDIWESCVYLGKDGYVYHIFADTVRGKLKVTVAGKRAIGDYLRWVDGLFQPGDLPSASTSVHYRAAKALRELL